MGNMKLIPQSHVYSLSNDLHINKKFQTENLNLGKPLQPNSEYQRLKKNLHRKMDAQKC